MIPDQVFQAMHWAAGASWMDMTDAEMTITPLRSGGVSVMITPPMTVAIRDAKEAMRFGVVGADYVREQLTLRSPWWRFWS